jgi:hypothetical protein
MEQFIKFLEELLKFLQQLLGGNPGTDNPNTPPTTPTPCNPGDTGSPVPSEAAPSDVPSETLAPSLPEISTTAAPSAAPFPSNVPPSQTPSGAPGGNVPPNTSTCGGKYRLTNPRKKNFGDPSCNFTKNDLFTLLKQQDPANATKWFNTVVSCESGYNPNAYASPATGTPDKGGAWGLFQMGQGKNGTYDHGDVEWRLQASNAVNYNNKVIKGNWRYWACAKAFWK